MNDNLPDNDSKTDNIDHVVDGVLMPHLGLKVLIVGNCFRSGAVSMFAAAACTPANSVEDADVVCFLGGEDIDPVLYGEMAMRGTYFSKARDSIDVAFVEKCLELNKPMFGICRGFQLLGAMNGNKLWQHVERHASGPHEIVDVATGEKILASSMHHQMVIENSSTFPLAYSNGHAKEYFSYGREMSSDHHKDLEAAVFPAINAIGVQGHPEVGGLPEYTAWCLTKLEEFLDESLGDNVRPIVEAIPPRIN